MKEKRVIILGSTGSIGESSFDVIRNLGAGYRIVGLSCHSRVENMLSRAEEFGVRNLAVTNEEAAREHLDSEEHIDSGSPPDQGDHPQGSDGRLIKWTGPDAVRELLHETDADIVINGIAGSAGLMPSVWSLETGKDLALANKETIVIAGPLIRDLANRMGRRIIPVDSEHSAIFHLLNRTRLEELEKVVITASGGAFRDTPLEDFPGLTLRDALKHPTWDMGPKITIDSATMANKGLEIIEAHYLFDLEPEQISVLIHPQSTIHSMIKTLEGSFYAQISYPDMRIPIQNALTFPEVKESPFGKLDFTARDLTFFEADYRRYPIVPLAYEAIRRGGCMPAAFNAANEAAVDAFRNGQIDFIDIAPVVERTLQYDWSRPHSDFASALSLHQKAWDRALALIDKGRKPQK